VKRCFSGHEQRESVPLRRRRWRHFRSAGYDDYVAGDVTDDVRGGWWRDDGVAVRGVCDLPAVTRRTGLPGRSSTTASD